VPAKICGPERRQSSGLFRLLPARRFPLVLHCTDFSAASPEECVLIKQVAVSGWPTGIASVKHAAEDGVRQVGTG